MAQSHLRFLCTTIVQASDTNNMWGLVKNSDVLCHSDWVLRMWEYLCELSLFSKGRGSYQEFFHISVAVWFIGWIFILLSVMPHSLPGTGITNQLIAEHTVNLKRNSQRTLKSPTVTNKQGSALGIPVPLWACMKKATRAEKYVTLLKSTSSLIGLIRNVSVFCFFQFQFQSLKLLFHHLLC